MSSQEVRALLVARKQLLGRLIDVELSVRGILRGFGLKIGVVTRKGFEARVRELVTGQATLERITRAMLIALLLREPSMAKAETYFERALAVARQQQAKSWELRASMSLARLWREQGKMQEAVELLAPVYGWFTRGSTRVI